MIISTDSALKQKKKVEKQSFWQKTTHKKQLQRVVNGD